MFASLSVLFVLISISGLVLGSLPELQVSVQKNTTQGILTSILLIIRHFPLQNRTLWVRHGRQPLIITAIAGLINDMEPLPVLGYIEYVCIVWFTLEYGRFLCGDIHATVSSVV